MYALIFTYNQQSLLQLTFANVSNLQCGPRQVEDMTTVVGNIKGKNRYPNFKMFCTDCIISNNHVFTPCSITMLLTHSCCIITIDLGQDKFFLAVPAKQLNPLTHHNVFGITYCSQTSRSLTSSNFSYLQV